MKKLIFSLLIMTLGWTVANAQSVGINSDGSSPNGSAMLDVSSSTKGFLVPRLTLAQQTAIEAQQKQIDELKRLVEVLMKK